MVLKITSRLFFYSIHASDLMVKRKLVGLKKKRRSIVMRSQVSVVHHPADS